MNLRELDIKTILSDVSNVAFVFAHPDDEVPFSSGLALRMKSAKPELKTKLITCSRGEASTLNFIDAQDLAAARTKELQQSAKLIGFDEVIIGDFPDGELPINEDRLKGFIDGHCQDTQLFVVMEPKGISGHTDHQTVSGIVKSLADKRLVIYATVSIDFLDNIAESAIENVTMPLAPNKQLRLTPREADTKMKAFTAHASQWSGGDVTMAHWKDLGVLQNEYFYVA